MIEEKYIVPYEFGYTGKKTILKDSWKLQVVLYVRRQG